MRTIQNLTRLIYVGLIFLLVTISLPTDAAYARGGCFGSGTNILTPGGEQSIEDLHSSDQIIGFNLSTHQLETEKIGKVQAVKSSEYYLINGSTRVTGSHPFYVSRGDTLQLIKVQDLKVGDQILGINEHPITISDIQYIEEEILVFNLLDITPNHNFYADDFLVHNKGGGGSGGGGGGFGGYYGGGGGRSEFEQPQSIPGLLLCLCIITISLLPLAFYHEIRNFIRFRGKDFTDDPELVEFVESINKEFKNHYSLYYSSDNEKWQRIEPESELNKSEYESLISGAEFIEKIRALFIQYQTDWTHKAFDNMAEYIAEPFNTQQREIFLKDFGDNFDVVHQPVLSEIIPLGYRQSEAGAVFQVQINGEMINFELSPKGFVLSGAAHPRSFTEYWEIGVDIHRRCYLVGISQPIAVPSNVWA